MKTTQKIGGLMLLAALSTSCVSNKKYNDLAERSEGLERKNAELYAEIDDLNVELNNIKTTASLTISEKELALDLKEEELAKREERLEELEGLVNYQQEALQSLHQEVCSALKCFTPEELTIDVRKGKLYVSLSDKLLFESGSDDVNDRGEEAIAMLAAVLSNSDLEVMVEGHTDNVPIRTANYQDNWDLSVSRATGVTRILIDHGIEPERLIASGRGEFQPIADNQTVEGKQKNRRTEIVLTPRLDKLWKLADGPALTAE